MGEEALAFLSGPIPENLPPLGPLRHQKEAKELIRTWTDPKWLPLSNARIALKESKSAFELAAREEMYFCFTGDFAFWIHSFDKGNQNLASEAKRGVLEGAVDSRLTGEYQPHLKAMLLSEAAAQFGRGMLEFLRQIPVGPPFSNLLPDALRMAALTEADLEAMKQAPVQDRILARDMAGLLGLASVAVRPPREQGAALLVGFDVKSDPPEGFDARWIDWDAAQELFRTRSEEALSKRGYELAVKQTKVRPPTHNCIIELLELSGRKSRMLVVTDYKELLAMDFLLGPLGLAPPRDRTEVDWSRPLSNQESAAILGRLESLNSLPVEDFEAQARVFMKKFAGSEGAAGATFELLDDIVRGAIEKFYAKASKKDEPVTLLACKDMWGELGPDG